MMRTHNSELRGMEWPAEQGDIVRYGPALAGSVPAGAIAAQHAVGVWSTTVLISTRCTLITLLLTQGTATAARRLRSATGSCPVPAAGKKTRAPSCQITFNRSPRHPRKQNRARWADRAAAPPAPPTTTSSRTPSSCRCSWSSAIPALPAEGVALPLRHRVYDHARPARQHDLYPTRRNKRTGRRWHVLRGDWALR
jgi:hypothetical protein